jgi:hypothetical protein
MFLRDISLEIFLFGAKYLISVIYVGLNCGKYAPKTLK